LDTLIFKKERPPNKSMIDIDGLLPNIEDSFRYQLPKLSMTSFNDISF